MGLTQQLSSIMTQEDDGQLAMDRALSDDQNPFGSPQSVAVVSSTSDPLSTLHTSETRYQDEQSPQSVPLVTPCLGTVLLGNETRDLDRQIVGDITSIARTSNNSSIVTLVSEDTPQGVNQATQDDMQS